MSIHFHKGYVPIGVRIAEQGNLLQEHAHRMKLRENAQGLFPFSYLNEEELYLEFNDRPITDESDGPGEV